MAKLGEWNKKKQMLKSIKRSRSKKKNGWGQIFGSGNRMGRLGMKSRRGRRNAEAKGVDGSYRY